MLTDDQARDLMHRAADTIEVGPGQPVPASPPGPRWPLLVAAVTVLIVAVAGAVVSRDDDAPPTPSGPPKGEPIEQPEVLDPDQIPSVLGYDLDEATELLEGKGLTVVRRDQPERCQPSGIVTGTEPSIGAKFAPGDAVQVFVTSPKEARDCVGEPPWAQIWDLIRFARGVAGPPELTNDLTLYVEGADPVTITREQAADPDSWTLCDDDRECHSALAAIEQMATQTWTMNGRHYTPRPLVAVGRDERCPWTPPPPMGTSIPQAKFWVEVPTDGVALCPRLMVGLLIDPATGGLAQVSMDLPEEVPDSPPEPTAVQREVSDSFVAWARDESAPAPAFADRVEVLLNDDPWEELSAEDAAARGSFSYCSGLPPEQCGVNPLRILDDYDGPVVQTRTLASMCAPKPRHLSAALETAVDEELVRLDQPEAENCADAFAVELWITEDGEIRAVNLILPSG